MALNASFGKMSGGIGGSFPLRGKTIIFDPFFTYPRNTGKTMSMSTLAMIQSMGRGLRNFNNRSATPIEYFGVLDGHLLKQVCRHISGTAISTNPEVLKLLDNWTFNVLVDHPGLRDQLLTLIVIDHDMDELHEELWRTKNWSNKALHERTWNRAKEQIRQAQEDYELVRRLTDPDCPYLVYNPKH